MLRQKNSRALAVSRSSVLPPASAGLTVPAADRRRRRATRACGFSISSPPTSATRTRRAAYAVAVRAFFAWLDAKHVATARGGAHTSRLGLRRGCWAAATARRPSSSTSPRSACCSTGDRRQIVPAPIPAAAVRGPKHVVKKGKTPVLDGDEAKKLLDSIDVSTIVGLRDRALIALLVYTFARVSAALHMNVEDYYPQGKRWWVRLHEKGGKAHAVPVHHKAEEYLDAYLAALGNPAKGPLFRAMTKERRFGKTRLSRIDAFRMVKRRCADAGLGDTPNCHTFRATGITAYLLNGGTIEGAQAIAAHESPRTTKLYDRTSDEITLAEIERIAI
jgi:integrase/recombinase XerD